MYVEDNSLSWPQKATVIFSFLVLMASLGVLTLFYHDFGFAPPPDVDGRVPGAFFLTLIPCAALAGFITSTTSLLIMETGRLQNAAAESVYSSRVWPVLAMLTGLVTLAGRDLIVWVLYYADLIDNTFTLPAWPSHLMTSLVFVGAVAAVFRQLRR